MAQIATLVALIFISAASQVTTLGSTLDCECGREDLNVVSRIFGGRNAVKTKLPWIASVLVPANDEGGYNLCTGSLINDRYILTAASCFPTTRVDPSKLYVSIKTETKYDYTRNTLKIADYFVHPAYKEFVGNNVALIKLENRIDFNRTTTDGKQDVSPICLASFGDYTIGALSTAGFGYVDNQYKQADQLMEVDVTELESMECIKSYQENSNGDLINVKKFICAQSEEKGINVGDFGAPLAVRYGSTVYQAGVASHYFIRNARPYGKLFDVYERINHLVPWIESNTEDANWCRAPLQAIQPKASCEAEKKELEQTRKNYENEKLAREKAEKEENARKEQEKKEKAEREAREEAQRKEDERKAQEAAEEQKRKEAAEAAERERKEKEERNPPPANKPHAFNPIQTNDADSTKNEQTRSESSDQTSGPKSGSEKTSSEGIASGSEEQAVPVASESSTKKETGSTCGDKKNTKTVSGTWEVYANGKYPPSAVIGGNEDGSGNTYICRAMHDGNLVQGKLVPDQSFCYIGLKGIEHQKSDYEVLVNKEGFDLGWKVSEGGEFPENAIVSGDESGCHTFICRIKGENNHILIGRLPSQSDQCSVPYKGGEKGYKEYEILYRKE